MKNMVNLHDKKNPKYNGSPQTLASYSYHMTRLDFLRVAEAIMKDYQNKTCVGNYLRESQQQAKKWYKYRPSTDNARFGLIIMQKNMVLNFILIFIK